MCDLEGDIETVGLFVNTVVSVSPCGVVNPNPSEVGENKTLEVKGVYSCVGCSTTDVLPFLGHDGQVTSHYMLNDNYIPYKENLVKKFNNLDSRMPGVYLVREADQLMGVLIEPHNKARVLGAVTLVLPQVDQSGHMKNVLLLTGDGKLQLTDSKTVDLNHLAETDCTVGVVSVDGFLLVEDSQEGGQLALILQHGYLVVQGDRKVAWMRPCADKMTFAQLSGSEPIPYKQTQVACNEIFVVSAGAILSNEQEEVKPKMALFGSQTAIMDYEAFKQACLSCYGRAQKTPSKSAGYSQ